MIAVAAFAAAALCSAQTPYDSVFDQLRSLKPDSVAPVRALRLHRDALSLSLDSGFLYLLTAVGGRTVGVAFLGQGSVWFAPPLLVEQFNLRRVLGDSTISGPITAAVFVFADSSERELTRSLHFHPWSQGTGDVSGPIGDALGYLVDGHSHSVNVGLMTAILNHTTSGYFAAFLQRQRGESVLFQFDPTESEEVSLLRRGRIPGLRVETVCQFERAEDLVNNVEVGAKQPEPLAIDSYDIDATIDGNYNMSTRVTLRLIGRRDVQRWAHLVLYDELDVDSVTTPTGEPLIHYRHDHASPLWVRFAKPVGPGDTAAVRVVYHGRVIDVGSALQHFRPPWWDSTLQVHVPTLDSWAFIKSTETWYPRYSFEQDASLKMTFRTPKYLKFASIGRLVSSDTEGNTLVTRWETELPTTQVSFNIGKFEQLDIRDPRIPPVTVHLNADAHSVISRLFPHTSRPEELVGADVVNSLSFFTKVYGPPLYHHYYATEIPYFHGQAFPGMIHLSWWTFVGMRSKGDDESFRAHEMAHQWWGIGVEPASYREAWIAEGFAEFSGLWYMQVILHDNDTYFKKLRESFDHIRHVRNQAAPIGLGYRAAENRKGNYTVTTYEKGAWILQMLRNMMINPRTMSEERFTTMMRDFYETYRGKRASTPDFQRMVEKHIGQPMDWFFDEWVYGTAVPTYTFAWKAEPDSTGVTAHMRVRQTDVPDDFAMFVPVLIKFDQGEALVRLLVRGPTTEVQLHLPAQPVSMELNPLESVLADVKSEGWD